MTTERSWRAIVFTAMVQCIQGSEAGYTAAISLGTQSPTQLPTKPSQTMR